MDILDPEEHIPWITYEAIEWINSYLHKRMNVYEFGSGGSTLYFAKSVGSVVSVEHDEAWFNNVSEALDRYKAKNVSYFLKRPFFTKLAQHLPYHHLMYVSRTFPEHRDYIFRSYARSIKQYPNQYFDFVFVDGRSRVSCIHSAIGKIKNGGYLMLDNSERDIYQPYMKSLERFDRKDFFGNGPRLEQPWQTTIWKISSSLK